MQMEETQETIECFKELGILPFMPHTASVKIKMSLQCVFDVLIIIIAK
jgi:hypothetical protein